VTPDGRLLECGLRSWTAQRWSYGWLANGPNPERIECQPKPICLVDYTVLKGGCRRGHTVLGTGLNFAVKCGLVEGNAREVAQLLRSSRHAMTTLVFHFAACEKERLIDWSGSIAHPCQQPHDMIWAYSYIYIASSSWRTVLGVVHILRHHGCKGGRVRSTQ